MPNIKSAEKRDRQAAKSRAKNRVAMSRINTERRKVLDPKELDEAAAKKALADYSSVLDKSVKQGVIKQNTADRRKSRAAKRIAAITKK